MALPAPAVAQPAKTRAIIALQLAGFKGDALNTAIGISGAETGGTYSNTVDSPPNSDGSIDRGFMQINNKAHPDVSDACAHSYICAARAAWKISNQGTNFNPWTTFTSGAYKAHLPGQGGLPSDIGHAASAVGGAAASVVNAPLELAKHVWNIIGYVFTADFWLRTLKIVAGGVAITIALIMAMKEFNITPPIPIPV